MAKMYLKICMGIFILFVIILAGFIPYYFWYKGFFTPTVGELLGSKKIRLDEPYQIRLKVGNQEANAVLAYTPQQRARGLSHHPKLGENEGMLFLFQSRERHTFWMKGMQFSLDFIWMDGDRVVDITENVPPPSGISDVLKLYGPSFPVNRVLEINAGWVAKRGIKIGDQVEFIW